MKLNEKTVQNLINSLDIIFLLLNGSIIVVILISLIFNARNNLTLLESVAVVYRNVPFGAIRKYELDVRESILHLVFGLLLIAVLTGYQSYIIKTRGYKYPKQLLFFSFLLVLSWSILLVLIIELILFPKRAVLILNAPLPPDISVQTSKALTNLDIFRWYPCMILFSILTIVAVIMLIWTIAVYKSGIEYLVEFVFSLTLYLVSYLILITLPDYVVYPGGIGITSGIYYSEIPPMIWLIVAFTPIKLASVIKTITQPLIILLLIAIFMVGHNKDKILSIISNR